MHVLCTNKKIRLCPEYFWGKNGALRIWPKFSPKSLSWGFEAASATAHWYILLFPAVLWQKMHLLLFRMLPSGLRLHMLRFVAKALPRQRTPLSLGTAVPLGDAFAFKCGFFSISDICGSKAFDGILTLTRNVTTRESHRKARSACQW